MSEEQNKGLGCVGHLDAFKEGRIVGWAWNPSAPDQALEISFYLNNHFIGKALANQFRGDLLQAGVGNGAHAFCFQMDTGGLSEPFLISARLSDSHRELQNSPFRIGTEKTKKETHYPVLKIDTGNIDAVLATFDRAKVDHLLIDINDFCNANCVYCPNVRSKNQISLDQFRTLLCESLSHVKTWQFGCGQEPTADLRLSEFYRTLASSSLRPTWIQMITNATLLKKHDVETWRASNLSELQVSIDTVDEQINAQTRIGTDVVRIIENLNCFKERCPDVEISFSIVVNKMTIAGIEDLLRFGEDLQVQRYHLREISDTFTTAGVTRRADYQQWMDRLLLSSGEFAGLQNHLRTHPAYSKCNFAPFERLHQTHTKMKSYAQIASTN